MGRRRFSCTTISFLQEGRLRLLAPTHIWEYTIFRTSLQFETCSSALYQKRVWFLVLLERMLPKPFSGHPIQKVSHGYSCSTHNILRPKGLLESSSRECRPTILIGLHQESANPSPKTHHKMQTNSTPAHHSRRVRGSTLLACLFSSLFHSFTVSKVFPT